MPNIGEKDSVLKQTNEKQFTSEISNGDDGDAIWKAAPDLLSKEGWSRERVMFKSKVSVGLRNLECLKNLF